MTTTVKDSLVAFFADPDDPDVRKLAHVLEEALGIRCCSPCPTAEELARLAPAALVVQGAPSLPVLTLIKGYSAELDVPVLGLLDEEDLGRSDFPHWNDFAIRPWHPVEATIRLRRLLQRLPTSNDPGLLRWGRLTLDTDRFVTLADSTHVDLTYTEFRILALLMTNGRRVVTREVLFKEVWGSEFYKGIRTVETHIRRLRSKLEAEGCPYIATVRNVGYRLLMPDRAGMQL